MCVEIRLTKTNFHNNNYNNTNINNNKIIHITETIYFEPADWYGTTGLLVLFEAVAVGALGVFGEDPDGAPSYVLSCYNS